VGGGRVGAAGRWGGGVVIEVVAYVLAGAFCVVLGMFAARLRRGQKPFDPGPIDFPPVSSAYGLGLVTGHPCPFCGQDGWPEGGLYQARDIHIRAHERESRP
jgi:hypothetical protein